MSEVQRRGLPPGHEDPRSEDPPSVQDTLVREPLQDRSRRTLERLVAAAARLLEEHGPDAVTVTGVTREARTSVGAFYARFSGKEEMVRYLGERWLAEALERWRVVAADVGSGGRVELRQGLTTLAGLYLNGPARRLALLHGQDDPSPGRLRRFEDQVAEALAAGGLAAEEGSEAELSDPTRFLRAVAVVAGVRELGVRATEGRGPSAGLGPGTLAEIMVGLSRLSPGRHEDGPAEGPHAGPDMPRREREPEDPWSWAQADGSEGRVEGDLLAPEPEDAPVSDETTQTSSTPDSALLAVERGAESDTEGDVEHDVETVSREVPSEEVPEEETPEEDTLEEETLEEETPEEETPEEETADEKDPGDEADEEEPDVFDVWG